MRSLTKISRLLFYFLLAFMGFLGFVALYTRIPPAVPLDATQIERTVQVGVNLRLTEVASLWTPTPTPDINATIEARVITVQTPTETATLIAPTPTPEEPRESSNIWNWIGALFQGIFSVIGFVWSIIVGVWNFAGYGGACLQVLGCIVLPIGLFLIYILKQ